MKRLLRGFTMAGLAAVMALGTQIAMAQEGPPRDRDGEFREGGRRGGQRGNFDPAEFQARMMQRMQDQLGSTDEEWGGIEPLLGKVMESQRAANAGRRGGGFRGPRGGGGRGGQGFRGQRGPRPGGPGGPPPGGPEAGRGGPPPGGPEGAEGPQAGRRGPRPGGPPPGGGRGGGRGRGGRGGFGGPPPSPEAMALQETLNSDSASPKEIQTKLRAHRQANRQKQQELKRSRDNLRAVLTTKQEARLVLMGILD